ncbi:probable protein phosphatase 2C 34 [Phalaenopsis equestris]|uniref:probable protein phosphatase 2C 34 n=1 Tax=Phalaenopsis equestris TaxID=78828 RepID=UPI0009E1FEC2|nr:probable protein phosphatase 2C 34 [Phalaenopsis equestris]
MKDLFSLINGWARGLYSGRGWGEVVEEGRDVADALLMEARKNNLILKNSGTVCGERSNSFAAACSRRGEKGINQDCSIVCEEFGSQEDMIFCGIFDGHGAWGHHVARKVRRSLPASLLCNWQKTLALSSLDDNCPITCHSEMWKESFIRSCAAIDKELEEDPKLDSFNSGTTALSIVKQGQLLVIANVGDSRAVMATRADDGRLVPVQLTVDFKPNLPQEAERIKHCNGRVFCLRDEPGVHRIWLPNAEMPGLAMSRAFGDYCVKDFGVISVPEVTQRLISGRDQFIVLATDGVWDVMSNQEAIEIVSSTKDRRKSARQLVKCAIHAWKRKRRGIAVDDCSAVCLFFHSSQPMPIYSTIPSSPRKA